MLSTSMRICSLLLRHNLKSIGIDRLLLVMFDLLTQLVNPCKLNCSQRQIHKQSEPQKMGDDLTKKHDNIH
ncbi:conserved protein of unknown function [Xenorhabdus poinarii G6]|uniref:Uncharacterized protein n=1 Tax=Xenorhabdus poinarii G6 TaxID=1354304 RepID=A0A068QY39_9GAMM|nr:conserved protein of unknown function [Xenorhabdus poinarii G6]